MTPPVPRLLVTGFPFMPAARLVLGLLTRHPRARLTLLIQGKHEPLVRKLMKERLDAGQQKRLGFLVGDVTKVDLGLSGEEVTRLEAETSEIYHLAAIWDTGVPEGICRNVNVEGTRRLLALARSSPRLERFVHFSTVRVSGTRTGVIGEEEILPPAGFNNPLEKTRRRAEDLVRQEMEGGMPATLLRLGHVVGDSRTGEFMKFSGFWLFLRALLQLDKNAPVFLPGHGEAPTNLVPVDYVVEAALHLTALPETLGRTYHLTDPYPLNARTVFEGMCAYLGRPSPTFGIPRRLYPLVGWAPGLKPLARLPREEFDYLNHKAVYNCQQTLAALKGTGIECPRFESYLPLQVEYARDFLRRTLERREEAATLDPLDRED